MNLRTQLNSVQYDNDLLRERIRTMREEANSKLDATGDKLARLVTENQDLRAELGALKKVQIDKVAELAMFVGQHADLCDEVASAIETLNAALYGDVSAEDSDG